MNTSRDIIRKISARATPERTWKALTDPKALTKWFVRKARVIPGVDGTMELSWGGVRLPMRITLWRPAKTLALAWADGTHVRFDLNRRGDETVVTLTVLGYRDEIHGVEEWAEAREAWTYYLLNLKVFLERRSDLREHRRSRTYERGWVNHWD